MKKKLEKYTKEWFAEKGRIGGKKTKELYGTKHFAKIRRKKVDNLESIAETPIKVAS